MTDETHEKVDPIEVGFREDVPRRVHHQYELDRLEREWHSVPDNEVALRKGRSIIRTLMRWIMFREEFTDDDREEAVAAREMSEVVVKTTVKTRSIGTPDEHCVVEWDSYSMAVRQVDLPVALEHARKEALDTKLDAQSKATSILEGICDRRGLLQLDYKVGRDSKEKMDEEAGRY